MADEKTEIKGMLKNEYAEQIGIPESTLRRYINEDFIEEMLKLSYSPRQKHLTPKQIKFLNKKLVV